MIQISYEANFTADKAAITMAMRSMDQFGWTRDQEDLIESMTDAEMRAFMREYTKIYNSLARKIGADEVSPDQLLAYPFKMPEKD